MNSGNIRRQDSLSESQTSRTSEVELTQEERYNNKLLEAEQMVQNDRIEDAIDELRLLMQKINFMKQNKKDYDKKLELVVYLQFSSSLSKWSLDECIPLLQKFIALVKISLQQNLISSGLNLSAEKQGNNQHWFKLKTVLVKAMLQYCAILSQIGEHKKAFKIAIDITAQIRALLGRGYEQCAKLIAKKEAAQLKKGQGRGKPGIDKIQFSFSVLLSATDILQDLAKSLTYSEINEKKEIQGEMQEVKKNIYYWKSIPQNNIKTLRQSFGSSSQECEEKKKGNRNLLGIKRSQDWIEQFTIAKVMFMKPINYLQFLDSDNLIFEFNHRNLVYKVLF